MKRIVLVIAVIIMAVGPVFMSCQSGGDGKFPGFSKNDDGSMYYKFHNKSDDTTTLKVGDYITIDMIYAADDSIMFDSKDLPQLMKMPLIEPTFKGDIYDGMFMMHKGDSATFMCNSDSTFLKLFRMNPEMIPPGLDSIEYLTFHIKLQNVESLEEVQAQQKDELLRMEVEEETKRNNYLAQNYPTAKPTESGLFYIETKKGTGSTPEVGQKVKVHYKGMFMDGTVFDSSFDRDEPIEFPLGQGQVIKGWDEGISMMKKGGTAVLVIPSDIAYGPNGRGSIPPFSTLVFEVELVDF